MSHIVPIYAGYALPHAALRLDLPATTSPSFDGDLYERGNSFVTAVERELPVMSRKTHLHRLAFNRNDEASENSEDMKSDVKPTGFFTPTLLSGGTHSSPS